MITNTNTLTTQTEEEKVLQCRRNRNIIHDFLLKMRKSSKKDALLAHLDEMPNEFFNETHFWVEEQERFLTSPEFKTATKKAKENRKQMDRLFASMADTSAEAETNQEEDTIKEEEEKTMSEEKNIIEVAGWEVVECSDVLVSEVQDEKKEHVWSFLKMWDVNPEKYNCDKILVVEYSEGGTDSLLTFDGYIPNLSDLDSRDMDTLEATLKEHGYSGDIEIVLEKIVTACTEKLEVKSLNLTEEQLKQGKQEDQKYFPYTIIAMNLDWDDEECEFCLNPQLGLSKSGAYIMIDEDYNIEEINEYEAEEFYNDQIEKIKKYLYDESEIDYLRNYRGYSKEDFLKLISEDEIEMNKEGIVDYIDVLISCQLITSVMISLKEFEDDDKEFPFQASYEEMYPEVIEHFLKMVEEIKEGNTCYNLGSYKENIEPGVELYYYTIPTSEYSHSGTTPEGLYEVTCTESTPYNYYPPVETQEALNKILRDLRCGNIMIIEDCEDEIREGIKQGIFPSVLDVLEKYSRPIYMSNLEFNEDGFKQLGLVVPTLDSVFEAESKIIGRLFEEVNSSKIN